jgi:hypothetical protein
MFKLVITLFFLSSALFASSLHDKIANLIGAKQYQAHQNLIALIFTDQQNYYLANGNFNYVQILNALKQNGLLHLKLNEPKEIEVEFQTNKNPIKSLKLLNDTLKSIGYYYYFTTHTAFNKKGHLIWTIKLKTEFAIDPLVFVGEILKSQSKVIDITKEENDKWIYKIDTNFATISESIVIDNNELVKLQKPLRPYFIKVYDAKSLKIMSSALDAWHPHVVFYDKNLNVLQTIKHDKILRRLTLKIPEQTNYIKITDLFTLVNIKRGLSVIIKE